MHIRFCGISVHEEENRRLGWLLLDLDLLLFCRRVVNVVRENYSGLRWRRLVLAIVCRFRSAPANRRTLVELVLEMQLQLLVVVQKQNTLGLVAVVYELLQQLRIAGGHLLLQFVAVQCSNSVAHVLPHFLEHLFNKGGVGNSIF